MSYYDLGSHSRKITTTSPAAQLWFDRGLIWTYGYNHEEAIACFKRALREDPSCAMAHWGLAYAVGPNYNIPWHLLDPKSKADNLATAYDHSKEALANMAGTTPVEQALIDALPARYPQRDILKDQSPWNDDYADAMRAVYQDYPDDLEVTTIFVEAIMNRTPWKMWDLQNGGVAEGAGTLEAQSVLERAMREISESWSHPGLLHLYVHLMEMSPFPEKALRAGDRLRELVPDSGHLIHMPTHIDVLCGHYRDVVVYNQKGARWRIAASLLRRDRAAMGTTTPVIGCTTITSPSTAPCSSASLQAGNRGRPRSLSRMCADRPTCRITSPPMGDFLEGYIAMKQHVLIRFGKWEEIIAQDLPEDQELYCSTTAMMLYAKAVAHSALGSIEAAEQARAAFLLAKEKVPDSRRVHNNIVSDLLAIAEEMLNGELAYRRGNYEKAFGHLRRSVELDDALPYDEPWGWMQPARHALGALLLEQGRAEEAEAVYRADLGLDRTLSRACQHPGNLWSLHGLYECLTRRGESVEALHVKQQLDQALARAEVEVKASCYCRREFVA